MMSRESVLRSSLQGVAVCVALLLGGCSSAAKPAPAEVGPADTGPPPAAGYYTTKPAGAWSSLPGGHWCARNLHSSDWEPRPANAETNQYVPDPTRVQRALLRRQKGTSSHQDRRWVTWLLPRVDGQYTGTTDEIIQWAACKWGVSDNLLRAIAEQESTWYQRLLYRNGRCVVQLGCGDLVKRPSAATRKYCDVLARHGRDYQADFRRGVCPETFGLMGVKSWQAPSWGRMRGNQNGTFPFNRDSTAFNVDYRAADLRGCLEGWQRWLDGTGTRNYRPGKVWGCVGAWYSGDWRTPAADRYIAQVKRLLRDRPWLRPEWINARPQCPPRHGCPVSE